MRVAICDDNPVDLQHLEGLARQYGRAQGLNLQVATYQSTEAYLEKETQPGPDVLLLDIYMSETGADGLELAGKLRAAGFEGPMRGPVPVAMSLAEVVERIGDDARFLKCFRSYVVNMDHIMRTDGDHFVMDNGDRVPITKREAAAIEATYMGYCFAKGGKP